MARPEFIVLGFPEQGFVLSLGFTAFATNERPFYNYNTPVFCVPHSHMSFTGAVASLTSHRESKVCALFSSFVWLGTNDVEGKHCTDRQKRESGRQRRKKRGKSKKGK